MAPEEAAKPTKPETLPMKAADVGVVQKFDDKIFADITKAGDFLGRVQLMTSRSKPCDSGDFPINHYALVNGPTHKDLGKDPDVFLFTWRPKALDTQEGVAAYNPAEKEFQAIADASKEKDSGCMYGVEFLVYIPAVKEFATFFMGSASARLESAVVKSILAKWQKGDVPTPAATLKSKFIETKKYSWHCPTAVACSTPLEAPAPADVKIQVEKFNNPPAVSKELAPEDGKEKKERAQ